MKEQKLELVEPCEELREAYIEYVEEFRASNEPYHQGELAEIDKNFNNFVRNIESWASGIVSPEDRVPSNTYWLVWQGRVVASGRLRHQLTEALRDEGGHIGYDVRPSERRKGYGTLTLKLLLDKARQLDLKRVLLTCDKDNVASAKVIQKNGGKLASESISKKTGKMMQRYWIEL